MSVFLLGLLGTIFKPANMIKWIPALLIVGGIAFVGVRVHNYMKSADDAKAEVIQQRKDIADLAKAVNEEKASVVIATTAMQQYETAVQNYASSQQQIQQQITHVRKALDTAPILQKAQTNAQDASSDLNSNYADMLGMFDNATRSATSASHSAASEATAAASSTSPN